MFAIIGKVVVALALVCVSLLGVNRISYHRAVRRAEASRLAHTEFVTLLAADGAVTKIVPATIMDKDGRLPNIITFQGKTYERGWTNYGNTDRDERLWFEVTKS